MNKKEYYKTQYMLDVEKMIAFTSNTSDIELELETLKQKYSYLCGIESIDMDFEIGGK